MDRPGLDPARHREALRALARVNRLSLTAWRVWREITRIHEMRGGAVRVLDVACGGGDVLAAVARRASAAGVSVELVGCDASGVALDDAARRVVDAAPELRLETHRADVTRDALPDGADLVCSSLFLHHLERADAARLLGVMADAARRTLLVQDLRRTRIGWWLAAATLRVVTRSEIARHDGPTSVAGAFTLDEVRGLAWQAGLTDAELGPAWPQRWTLRWRRA